MMGARLLVPGGVLVADLIGSGTTWAAWEATGHDGLSPALSVVCLAAPVGLLAAAFLPDWMARRLGRGLGVGALSPDAPQLWRRVHHLVLDPQTSLTTGRLVVTDVQAVDADHERNLRWFAGALAHALDDPVGHAVARLSGPGRVTEVTRFPGRGIRGSVDRHPVRVGEPAWIGLDGATEQPEVGTMLGVEVDQRPLGRITVADEVRTDSAGQLGRLRKIGMTPVLASPGREQAVARLAQLSASPEWHAETDPGRLAEELATAGEATGLVQVGADGEVTLVVVERAAPGGVEHRRAAALTGAAVDRLVHAVTLILSVGRARRRAIATTWVLMLLAVPFAVLGLIPPVAALALAGLSWLVVAATALWGFPAIPRAGRPEA